MEIDQLLRHINHAEQQLQDSPGDDGTEDMAIMFTGNWHDSLPRKLIICDQLSPSDKITWQVIRLTIDSPTRPGVVANRTMLASMINCSAPTVSAAKIALRLTRWITYCRTVRRNGQFVGDIYLLHDSPLDIGTTLEIDKEYVDFVLANTEANSKHHRLIAESILDLIDSQKKLNSPTEVEKIAGSLNHAADQKPSQSKNFAAVKSDNFNKVDQKTLQSKNFVAVKDDKPPIHQSKNFALGGKTTNFGAKTPKNPEKFFPVRVCSSHTCSSRDTTSLLTDASAGAGVNSRLTESEKRDLAKDWVDPALKAVEIDYLKYKTDIEYHLPEYTPIVIRRYVVELLGKFPRMLTAFPRLLRPLSQQQRKEVLFQLLSKAACDHHGYGEQRLVKPIAYLSTLAKSAIKGSLVLDDFAYELMDAVDTGTEPYIFDSAKKIQRKTEMRKMLVSESD